MPGARDIDWTHVRVVGNDHAAAAPYLGFGRKLLGFVKHDAAFNGLTTHMASRTLQDGAIVTAEIHGTIPRITIVPPGKVETKTPAVKDNFVIRLRSADAPDGIDPDVPETLERVDSKAWRTLFHSTTTPGYASFTGKKGTYRTNNGIDVFPVGVTHAGNVDWRSRDGLRLSWYGPSARYFFDPYVKPRSQFGKFVFLLGQVLLDVEQYITDSDPAPAFAARWVMGAALRGRTELIVVHAVLPEPAWPTGTAGAGDYRMEQPWPVGDVAIEVCRYTLTATAGLGAPFVRVIAGSRTVLASAALRNALNPWCFSADARQASSMGLPDNVFVRRDGSEPLAPLPSSSNNAYSLTLADDTANITTGSNSLAPGASAVIAVDYAGNTRVELLAARTTNADGFDVRELRLGATTVRLRDVSDFRDIAGRPGSTFDRRHLLWADLREGVLVIANHQSWQRLNAISPAIYHRIEVHHAGAVVGTFTQFTRSTDEGEFTGLRRLAGAYHPASEDADSNPLRAATFAPMQVIYEILDWAPETANRQYWQGAHGMYLNLAYPASAYFGSFVEGRDPVSNPLLELSTVATVNAPYNYVQQDVHDHYSVLGCASYDGVTVFSGYQVNLGGYADDEHIATFTAPFYEGFPQLGGTQRRFHPVWLLGTLP